MNEINGYVLLEKIDNPDLTALVSQPQFMKTGLYTRQIFTKWHSQRFARVEKTDGVEYLQTGRFRQGHDKFFDRTAACGSFIVPNLHVGHYKPELMLKQRFR